MNEEALEVKLNAMHEDIKENGSVVRELFKFIHVGNGKPSLKTEVDRNSQRLKLILWLLGISYAGGVAALFRWIITL